MSKLIYTLLGMVIAGVFFALALLLAGFLVPLAAGYSRTMAEALPAPGVLALLTAVAVYQGNAKAFVAGPRKDFAVRPVVSPLVHATWFIGGIFRVFFAAAYFFDKGIMPTITLYLAAIALGFVFTPIASLLYRILTPDWLLNRLSPSDFWVARLVIILALWPAVTVLGLTASWFGWLSS